MNYQAKAEKVAKAIRKNGKTIILIKDNSSFNPETRKSTANDTPDPGYCIEEKADIKWNDSGTVLNKARKLLCVDIEDPRPGENITVDDKTSKILLVNPIMPGDVVLLYEVYIK